MRNIYSRYTTLLFSLFFLVMGLPVASRPKHLQKKHRQSLHEISYLSRSKRNAVPRRHRPLSNTLKRRFATSPVNFSTKRTGEFSALPLAKKRFGRSLNDPQRSAPKINRLITQTSRDKQGGLSMLRFFCWSYMLTLVAGIGWILYKGYKDDHGFTIDTDGFNTTLTGEALTKLGWDQNKYMLAFASYEHWLDGIFNKWLTSWESLPFFRLFLASMVCSVTLTLGFWMLYTAFGGGSGYGTLSTSNQTIHIDVNPEIRMKNGDKFFHREIRYLQDKIARLENSKAKLTPPAVYYQVSPKPTNSTESVKVELDKEKKEEEENKSEVLKEEADVMPVFSVEDTNEQSDKETECFNETKEGQEEIYEENNIEGIKEEETPKEEKGHFLVSKKKVDEEEYDEEEDEEAVEVLYSSFSKT